MHEAGAREVEDVVRERAMGHPVRYTELVAWCIAGYTVLDYFGQDEGLR